MNEQNLSIRLKLFMDSRNMTNSQFADACGIPRPTLSQILSGRNKKISDVLIGQIHNSFPEVSVLWLLFGEGEMITTFSNSEINSTDNSVISTDVAHFNENAEEIAANLSHGVSNSAVNQGIIGQNLYGISSCEKSKIVIPERKISHITVYYDDSTFETFYPGSSDSKSNRQK